MPRSAHVDWDLHTEFVGGSRIWRCKYCQSVFTSSITGVVCHLSGRGGQGIGGCKEVPLDVVEAVLTENPRMEEGSPVASLDSHVEDEPSIDGSGSRRQRARTDDASSGHPSMSSNIGVACASISSAESRPYTQTVLSPAASACDRQRIADIEIGRTFMRCNLSFNVLQTEQWRRMVRAIGLAGFHDDWSGLSYEQMRTRVIDEEIDRIDEGLLPIREGWVRFGCTIMFDGWTGTRRRHIINILVSSCLGTYFLRAVDAGTGGETLSAQFIFDHIRAAIVEVGAQNVVQVITDDASNCRRMGEMVEQEFSHIVWTPCAAHSIHLLIEDIARIPWVAEVVEGAVSIATFFRRKTRALAMFREHSQLEIIRPSPIRFASMYLVLARLSLVRIPLRQTVVGGTWVDWLESLLPITQAVQRRILDDIFWTQVDALVEALRPLYRLIQLVSMEGSTMSLLYHMWMRARRQLLQESTSLSQDRVAQILQLMDQRWEFIRRPIHGMAALLHPHYRSTEVFSDSWLQECKNHYSLRALDEQTHLTFQDEFRVYMSECGTSFTHYTTRLPERTRKPLLWWEWSGFSAPVVQRLALRVLSQDCSTCACERNSSSYSLIHRRNRNRLSTRQLERLVYCRANLRLLESLRSLTGPKQVIAENLEQQPVPPAAAERESSFSIAEKSNIRQQH